jgi:FKBP-type peptidyl-prolyl cis-trans isomerase
MNGGTCWARVDVLTAPQGRLDALVNLVDSNNLPKGVNTQQWMQAALARQQKQGAQALAALTAQEKQESAMLYQQFQQIMARSQAEHQQFMQQQESQFQSAMNNANASMNAQSTAASDWVDYALDQQTVTGPNGTAKVSSEYSQTWSNGSQWYQTNDPNSNPNGVLKGNWTLTTKVHGNGQPE